jgi:thiol:disulfide interchange protein
MNLKSILALLLFMLTPFYALHAEEASNNSQNYQDYSAEAFQAVEGKNVLLNFHADWCGSCVNLEKDLQAHLTELPEDLVIFRVDFDNAADLRKEYAIRYQNSFVLLDKHKKVKKRFAGVITYNKLMAQIES